MRHSALFWLMAACVAAAPTAPENRSTASHAPPSRLRPGQFVATWNQIRRAVYFATAST